MILFFCPDIEVKSSGINRIYRHVNMLADAGFDVAVLHSESGFTRPDRPEVPVRYLDVEGSLQAGDTVLIPEGFPGLMKQMKDLPIRRFVFSLSWCYVYPSLPLNEDWRHYNVERVLVSCQYIGDMIGWAMRLPSHFISNSLNGELYYPEFSLQQKKKKIVFIKRKAELIPLLMRVLQSRNPRFIAEIEWLPLEGFSEEEYARHVREAAVFLNLSKAEGLLNASFEAMRSMTLCAGFDAIGGQSQISGSGDDQNYLQAETGDYLSLAWLLEPLLEDILNGNMSAWEKQAQNAYEYTLPMTYENEKESVVSLWRRLCPEALADSQNSSSESEATAKGA